MQEKYRKKLNNNNKKNSQWSICGRFVNVLRYFSGMNVRIYRAETLPSCYFPSINSTKKSWIIINFHRLPVIFIHIYQPSHHHHILHFSEIKFASFYHFFIISYCYKSPNELCWNKNRIKWNKKQTIWIYFHLFFSFDFRCR